MDLRDKPLSNKQSVLNWDSTKIINYLKQELGSHIPFDASKWSILNGRILNLIDNDDLVDLGIHNLSHRRQIIQKIDALLLKKEFSGNDRDLIKKE